MAKSPRSGRYNYDDIPGLAEEINSLLEHGLLLGLSSDDHTQYLPVNGSRAMTGNFDMGSNNIENVPQIGVSGDSDLLQLSSGLLTINGDATLTDTIPVLTMNGQGGRISRITGAEGSNHFIFFTNNGYQFYTNGNLQLSKGSVSSNPWDFQDNRIITTGKIEAADFDMFSATPVMRIGKDADEHFALTFNESERRSYMTHDDDTDSNLAHYIRFAIDTPSTGDDIWEWTSDGTNRMVLNSSSGLNLQALDITTTGDVTGGNLNVANWDAAYTHVSNDGSDHSLLSATAGTAAASKALVVDSSKNLASMGNIEIGTADGEFPWGGALSGQWIQIEDAAGRLHLAGSTLTAILQSDTGGAANEKHMLQVNIGGVYEFRILNDADGSTKDTPISIDMTQGDITIGNDLTVTNDILANNDIAADGKMDSIGGYDPPYVLIDLQTKEQIVMRCRQEIPPSKAGGKAIVNIIGDPRIKWFIPLTGEFYGEKTDENGWLVPVVIDTWDDGKCCYNENSITRYYYDRITDTIQTTEKAIYGNSFPEDKILNKDTGEIEDKP